MTHDNFSNDLREAAPAPNEGRKHQTIRKERAQTIRFILSAMLAVSAVGVADAAGNDRAQIIAAIRAVMIDPDSLKVNKITMYPPINGVKGACASINAKNRMGGYTGNQNIIIYNEKGHWRAGSATSILTCEDMRELHKDNAMSQ